MTPALLLALHLSSATVAAAGCPAGWPAFSPGWNRGLSVAGQSRSVFVLPPTGPAEGAPPLLVAFNGTTEDGQRFARRAHLQDFADRGFLVLSPSSAGNGEFWPVWDGLRARGREGEPNPDVELFDALVACAVEHHGADADRVYALGHSAGGIFTNHLVQRRSEVLAGVIVGSGLYSQTRPEPPVPMAPTTVVITWGGGNDRWSGRAGGAAVDQISFASEAAVAGAAYAAQEGVGVVSCSGQELGHAWLTDLNPWFIDLLLARPHGRDADQPLPALPAGARARCQAGPVSDAPTVGLVCPESAVPGCTHACQQIADGAATNRTVGAVLKGELKDLGFGEGSCGGCVSTCEALATTPADAQGLACWVQQPVVDRAVGGLGGALPLVDAIDTCCGPNDGAWCRTLCGELRGNLAARAYVPGCAR